jgi:hypothetical protein
MTLSNEQIIELAKGDEFAAQVVLTIDVLSDAIKNLSSRVEKLEEQAREHPTAKTLRLVNDGP